MEQTSTEEERPLLGVSVEVEWTAEEAAAFAEGIKAFRKNFAQVSRLYVPSKTVHDVIAYYYRCVLGPSPCLPLPRCEAVR